MASKGLAALPRTRGSTLAHGCGREGSGALPLARAAAVSTGLRVRGVAVGQQAALHREGVRDGLLLVRLRLRARVGVRVRVRVRVGVRVRIRVRVRVRVRARVRVRVRVRARARARVRVRVSSPPRRNR